MPIAQIHTYLVYPNKGVDDAAPIVGSAVPQEGKMFNLLREVYERADIECSIGIAFKRADDGAQVNPCRTILTNYARAPTVDTGRILAERLASFTTKRSGLGLMFLISGHEGKDHKIVLSRFRANNGVLVGEAPDALTVEFIDRIFMKNAQSYKAVAYQHASLDAGFWDGIAVDKQINSRDMETSNYWVKEFLASDFSTTPALGTRRLAIALRDASRGAGDLQIKQEITAAVTLAAGIDGQAMSAEDFFERFGFSQATKDAVRKVFSRADLVADNFRFSAEEFTRQLPFRTVELNSGAMLTAHSARFDHIFEQVVVDEAEKEVRFSTTGRVVAEKLEKTK